MRIAVLMSSYNGEKYIEEQIKSILSQTGNFELDLWVRDDGSVDNTIKILEYYQEKGKLRWYSDKNCGPAKSFFDLIYKAKEYDYYAFSDQDDYWYPNKITNAVEKLKKYDSGKKLLYFCNAEYVDSNLKPLGGKNYKGSVPTDFYSTLLNPGYLGCTMVFNNKLAEVIQNHSMPDVIFMHDEYLARVCVAVGGKVVFDDRAFIKYRQHGDNVIGSTIGKMDALMRRINMICKANRIGIKEELSGIKNIYGDEIGDMEKEWINTIICYKDSIKNKIKLALSSKPKFISTNMRWTIRFKILNGKL